MPPLLPREIQWNASVISSHRLRPSPQSDRVGISISVTRLPVGSLALRPAALPQGNLQPPVTRTLLPGARKVYGQLLSRDFNPIDMQPLRHTTRTVLLNPPKIFRQCQPWIGICDPERACFSRSSLAIAMTWKPGPFLQAWMILLIILVIATYLALVSGWCHGPQGL